MARLLPAAAGVILAAAYVSVIRPRHLRWGATQADLDREWPGDAYCRATAHQAMRAIEIDAPVEAVWPWIVQIGQDRAGFYSHTALENGRRRDARG